MIVVFTGGDDLEEEEVSFEDYLGRNPSGLSQSKSLFDNRTKDEDKKTHQRKNLLTMVDQVMKSNGGRPYTNEIFQELQRTEKEFRDLKERIKVLESVENSNSELSQLMGKRQKEYEEKFKQMIQMVESKLTEANLILKQQLAEEKGARLVAEKDAQLTKVKFIFETDNLKKDLMKARADLDTLETDCEKKDLENERVTNEMDSLKKNLEKASAELAIAKEGCTIL
ncbi:immune-associated nucleotide-binding protein 9-like [Impatiens glandulifera]|uniref:immune-associated nucleotide-binding protein 9-like n=1 Tax=Impatiens glandulifera TaxID=253017 RepID=UPI001FB0C018|nr:immune-associated nucleotide-binding protein 9-like [Impatiens glandulifera]